MSKAYETGNKVVKDISLIVDDGEFVFIVGGSGSGKSTLMKLFLKELEPTKGRIVMNGMDLRGMSGRYTSEHRRGLGVVSQDFKLLKDRTVFENVASTQRIIGMPSRIVRETVPEMLRLVELSSKYKAYPRQLPGGEQQRAVIARTLVSSPKVLPVDGPTGNLGNFNTREVMGLLEEVNQRGTTVIVIMHSQEMVDEMNKRIITMEQGSVISDVGGYYQGVAVAALESLRVCLPRRKGK